MPSQVKKEKVNTLKEAFKEAKAVYLVDYQGIDANQMSTLRMKIKEAGGKLEIAKNTLITLASDHIKEVPAGVTAVLYALEDVIAPLKPIQELFEIEKEPRFKMGILDEELLTGEKVAKLATLPGKDELIAKLVGQVKSPLYRLHGALVSNQRKLLLTLKAVAESKS